MNNIVSIKDKIQGALWGMCIGDSLAMPVHWYYDVSQIKRDFKEISKYESPKPQFVGSIMNLSNTGGGGRGSDKGSLVGDYILHGKKKFWVKGGNYHYHHGMNAGDNTLDNLVGNVLIESMIEKKNLDQEDFLERYIKFMTTPDTHNDVYAGTCHRMFFSNYFFQKKPVSECPDNDGHNVDAIDGLINVIPLAMAYYQDPFYQEKLQKAVLALRKSDVLLKYADIYFQLLRDCLKNENNLKQNLEKAANSVGFNLPQYVANNNQDPMTACYIESSFPAMLVFAYKYGDQPEKCLLRSANAGGENVNRGNVLGAVLGAVHGTQGWKKELIQGLTKHQQYEKQFENFYSTFYESNK